MSVLIKKNVQIIERNGKPEYAVLPYDDYIALTGYDNGQTVPHEVVEMMVVDDMSIIKAWRKYLGLTQKNVAAKAGISQSALAQIERAGQNPHRNTLVKLAKAMNLQLEQLDLEEN
ncbi:anaerobic benzoate catabolism transcriptional regulator [Limihaloglobus sulfuriphilus]|uniref:Anaerobic benzoate catabolism transcriptional regulator n=1 Tax=Limihaloglobus sulfuriphilus TaxID=1851148 RepID=A0A1Q2MH89_9BACT|nr:helix-turn-helix transcriptional regulator [Limihaloglobus sulfuriphilus]AQQ71898.1 anaerobic benzoate catabolism transcriptional regulator [Limihaloglobus sulfuriphilus]